MTTVLDEPASVRAQERSRTESGSKLQAQTTAIRLQIRWPGVRKALSTGQKESAARIFNAEVDLLTATKKLLDTSHPAFRAVSTVKSRTIANWRAQTLPYVEAGVRLVRRSAITALESDLYSAQSELAQAVLELDRCYADLVDQARRRLGHLFDPADYPTSVRDLFSFTWDYPTTTPPDYLRTVAPEIYELECQRVRDRFNEAVEIAESAFAEELTGLVSHLADRLSGESDGKPKVFRDSAISNLQEFFERFRNLSIGSDESLERLVSQAQNLIEGVMPSDLRSRETVRKRISDGLTRIESSLEGYLTDRPRRNIIRRPLS